MDEHGVVIDEYGPKYADLDLPIIDGLTAGRARAPRSTRRGRELAGRLIAALSPQPAVARRLSQVDVNDLHNAAVILTGDPALIYVGDDRFLQRLQSYLELSEALRARVPDIDYVDLRFDERIYVRPAAKAAGESRRRDVGSRQSVVGSQAVGRPAVEQSRCLAVRDSGCRAGGFVGRKERYLVGLDVGTSKVTAVVGEMLDGAGLDVVGLGVAESRGIRRGVVVNLEAAVDSIKKAIDEAELMAGVEIDSVHLALSGPHIKGFNSRGVIAVAGKNREITREDVRRAIEAAKAVSLPTGREILHVLPQDFVVDEQDGIGAPVGMTGARLEVNVHIITGSQSSTQNIVACVNRAGVNVAETVVEQLAASESVLTDDEKELGVALVDIGGGTTDIAIHERGSLWHTAVVGVGGDHFTNDIAVGLRTPVPDAEKIKRKCGCALSGMVAEDETMEVASVGGRKPRIMARRILSEILQPRAEEIFHMVWDEIRRAGYEKSLNSGIVLTGGGAILDGMPEIAEQIFDLPIRRGCPSGVGGLADHVNSPTFATGVGLALYGYRNAAGDASRAPVGAGALVRAAGRLRGLFREFF